MWKGVKSYSLLAMVILTASTVHGMEKRNKGDAEWLNFIAKKAKPEFKKDISLKDLFTADEPSEKHCPKLQPNELVKTMKEWQLNDPDSPGIVGGLINDLENAIDKKKNEAMRESLILVCNRDGEPLTVAWVERSKDFPASLYVSALYTKADSRRKNAPGDTNKGGGRAAIKAAILRSIMAGFDGDIALQSFDSNSFDFYTHLKLDCQTFRVIRGSNLPVPLIYCLYRNAKQITSEGAFPELKKLLIH